MKYPLIEKGWEIDLTKINEGYLYSEMIAYAENRNKAKSILLSEYGNDLELLHSDDQVSYINIPVRRCKEADKFLFEDENLTQYKIDSILRERQRTTELDLILTDESIDYCYIKKNGSYYRPNNCGYTSMEHRAGVYFKKEAISSAKSCQDLVIIPIDVEKHNKMISDEINELNSKLIKI